MALFFRKCKGSDPSNKWRAVEMGVMGAVAYLEPLTEARNRQT